MPTVSAEFAVQRRSVKERGNGPSEIQTRRLIAKAFAILKRKISLSQGTLWPEVQEAPGDLPATGPWHPRRSAGNLSRTSFPVALILVRVVGSSPSEFAVVLVARDAAGKSASGRLLDPMKLLC